MRRKILVTGGSGQLASCIDELKWVERKYDFIVVSHEEFDVTDSEYMDSYFEGSGITDVINCAAYTNVDGSEGEGKEMCKRVNNEGVKKLVECCDKHGIRLIHISTDYVSPFYQNKPLRPNDIINENDVHTEYGLQKLLGENCIKECNKNHSDTKKNHTIVRTAWLYSRFGKNFFKTILNKIRNTSDVCYVVYDQIGTPTFAEHLATFVVELLSVEDRPEVIHYTDSGVASWYDFAREIAMYYDAIDRVVPVETIPGKTERPSYSILSKKETEELIEREDMTRIQDWREGLSGCISNYLF